MRENVNIEIELKISTNCKDNNLLMVSISEVDLCIISPGDVFEMYL